MNRKEAINKHISDMLAVEEHILEAVSRQHDDERVKDDVRANKLVIEMERVLKTHIEALEGLAEQHDAKTQSRAKEAVTRLLGVAAGLYDKVRGKDPRSRDLRDDYVALSLAAMSYTSLHTFGLTVQEDSIADLALSHLKDITPLMVEISRVLPQVVATEVAEETDFPTKTDVVERAVKNTQSAWATEVTQQASV